MLIPEQGGKLGFLHGLGDGDGARGLGLTDLVDALGGERSGIRHLALLDDEGGAAAGILGNENTCWYVI